MSKYLSLSEESVHADNFKIEVCSSSKLHFEAAMAIAMSSAPGRFATNYTISNNCMILYWGPEADNNGSVKLSPIKLPYKMDTASSINFVWNWLQSLPDKEWPDKPDLDGSSSKGWKIETLNTAWGYEIVSITPEWMEHHK